MGRLWYDSLVSSVELAFFKNLLQVSKNIYKERKKGKMKVKSKVWLVVFALLLLVPLLTACGSAEESSVTMTSEVHRTKVLGRHPIWGVLALIFVLVSVTVILKTKKPEDGEYYGFEGFVSKHKLLLLLAVITIAVLVVLPSTLVTIKQTEIGVITRWGKAVNTATPGLNWIVPYIDRVMVFTAKDWTYSTMNSDFMAGSTDDYKDHPAALVTYDNVQASVTYTVIGRIDPTKVIHLYEHYGSLDEAVAKAVQTMSRIIVRQQLSNFTAKELYLEVDGADEAVEKKLKPHMEDAGLILVYFGFRKPTLGIDGDYEIQLNAEMVATQLAEVANKMTAVKKAEADQAVAEAEGQKQVAVLQAEAEAEATTAQQNALADAVLYAAEKQAQADKFAAAAEAYRITKLAEANKLLAAVLTPELIQYIKLMQWNGVLPQVTGVEGGILLSLE